MASALHFALRYCCLKTDLKVEAPLTKLSGPMSLVDVSSAVLMTFADAPLLGASEGRFSSVGRLLVSILISISVFSRCLFAASACALLAATVRNAPTYRVRNSGYQAVLAVGCALWLCQAAASSASMCLLFVSPCAFHLVRSQPGDVRVVRYSLFLGLITAALPTLTKVALRVLQRDMGTCDKAD